jgi:EpsD family peptidyl-prolyl cis-trans isomerase
MMLCVKESPLRSWAALILSCAALTLAGCGSPKDKAASQTAAKVNKDELTVHQINFFMQQQRGLRPEQADAASGQVLERLIDQQLALQKADDLKLDRDPRVVQQLEAARREVLSRAYVERVAEAAPRPSPEDIKKFYDDKPALFAQRRIYTIQEIAVEATPEQTKALRARLTASKSVNEFMEYLRANKVRFAGNQAVRAAELLPEQSLGAISRMKDGQATVVSTPVGFQIIVLAGSQPQPYSEEQARPIIEQFLLNERKRKLAEDDRKALRAGARIEYVGKFADAAASAAAAASAPAAATPLVTAQPADNGAPMAQAAPQAAPLPAPGQPPEKAAAGSGLSAADIGKGLGLK